MIKIKEKTIIEFYKDEKTVNDDFKSMEWVLKARQPDNKDWRPIFSKVYADKKRLVCTDTRRMHLINNSFEIIPGLYDVLVQNNKKILLSASDCEDKYPDYKPLIKNDIILTKIFENTEGLRDTNIARLYKNFYQQIENKNAVFGFDMSFMKQAFKSNTLMKIMIQLKEGNYSGTDPIRIQDGEENHIAVIMPIRLQDNDK